MEKVLSRVVGLVLVLSGVGKALTLKATVGIIGTYLPLPAYVLLLSVPLVCLLEIYLGLLLVIGIPPTRAGFLLGVVLFSALIGVNIGRLLAFPQTDCGCFGSLEAPKLAWAPIWTGIILLTYFAWNSHTTSRTPKIWIAVFIIASASLGMTSVRLANDMDAYPVIGIRDTSASPTGFGFRTKFSLDPTLIAGLAESFEEGILLGEEVNGGRRDIISKSTSQKVGEVVQWILPLPNSQATFGLTAILDVEGRIRGIHTLLPPRYVNGTQYAPGRIQWTKFVETLRRWPEDRYLRYQLEGGYTPAACDLCPLVIDALNNLKYQSFVAKMKGTGR